MESMENIAESIFDKAGEIFKKSFEEIDYTSSGNYFSMLITENKSNATECENIIKYIRDNVQQNYSGIFDVSVERRECIEDEFPDDIADIEIFLNWEKIYNKK